MGIEARKHVLIVDDDPDMRKMVELMLSGEGYDVDTASSGQECIASVHVRQPDAIILDILMPGMDGKQVTRVLKKKAETATIPIIFLTAVSEKASQQEALWDLGVDYYLTKPVDPSDLVDKVRQAVTYKKFAK